MTKRILTLMAASLLVGNGAMAGGYQVALQGQRQIGMGHTGTGLANDASSIFFNPGALSFTKKNSIMLGASFISSKVAYLAPTPSTYTASTDNPMGTPFQLYASYGMKEDSKLKFGLGVYTPYGSTVKWGEEWKGKYVLSQLSLSSIYIQPTASYRINDKIGFGAGINYVIGSVNLQKGVSISTNDGGNGTAELEGKTGNIGYNLGVYLKPSEKLSVGISYRSQVDAKVEGGDATFNVSSAVATSTFAGGKTKFDATLPLPQVATLGIGYMASEKLTLAFDVNWTGWSAYKELRFDYEKPVAGSTSTVSPRKYKDAFTIRAGAEYKATEALQVRAGAYYDMSPVNEGYMTPETPDQDRLGLTAGVGYSIGEKFSIDASFLWIEGMKREQKQSVVDSEGMGTNVLAGTYKQRALIPGIGLHYKF
jgi:long-chain fatty acid transport protein